MAEDTDGAAAPFPNGPETAGRVPDGRFVAGGPGGPGRPKGSRHRAQAALDAIGEAGAAEVLQAVLQAAKGGDMRAASILLDRVWPTRKGRAVEVALPPVASAADLVPALAAVVAAMGRGEVTPEEANPDYAPGCPGAGQAHGNGRSEDLVTKNFTKLAPVA